VPRPDIDDHDPSWPHSPAGDAANRFEFQNTPNAASAPLVIRQARHERDQRGVASHIVAPANLIEFRSLPPGEYDVKAASIGVDGQPRAIARAHVNVVESGASRCSSLPR